MRHLLPLSCWILSGISPIAAGDDDRGEDSPGPTAQPGLTVEQQHAAGILVAHPVAMKASERMEALGRVLDPTVLVSDFGETTTAASAEQAASAELARLQALYDGGAGASLKMLEAARAETARAQGQAQIAAARFALHWTPLAALSNEARRRLIQAAAVGRSLLVRAELPGKHVLGAYPDKAVLDVDGIQVPGRVLGPLRETTELQGVCLLIEVPDAPAGLGPGARMALALLPAQRSGLLLPREALLYDENGAYVYKQLMQAGGKTRYAPLKVRLMLPLGDGWLVDGVDGDDNIVVRGAGVLWSLQGVGVAQQEDD